MQVDAAILVRGLRARVQSVAPHDDCCELRLAVEPHGRPLVLLWPFDRPRPLDRQPRLRVVKPRQWVRHLRDLLATEIGPLTPRGQWREVDVVPYQLAPAIAIASGADRVLLSDEVGLGKTIQAGWIVADIVARNPNARVLLAVPASLRTQWIAELSRRFSLDAADVDARWMRAAIADLPADVSPWAAPGIYAISLDLLKRTDVCRSMSPHGWDALVVDEAHTAAAPTDRHAALAAIAAQARRVILITATPYSGDAAGFASMASLGAVDSSPPLMFRRCRADVGDPRTRRHRFATVRLTRAEKRLQRLLERYSELVWRGSGDGAGDARLAVTILRKRALSCAAAAARSLERRRDLLASRAPLPRQLGLFDDGDEVDDEVPSAILAAPGLADAALEQRWLDALIEAAHAASTRDSKLLYLQRLLRRVQGESAIVFTEYRDTLLYLSRELRASALLHGGLTARERSAVQERFNSEGGLLLATDAAAEGLNLHGRARIVLNYELPWNPARLEQRIGRVDRIGQSRTVHAITVTARDTAEDLVIANIARRLARVVATLGEGDRLGALLDEARVAHLVMDGASAPAPEEPPVTVARAVHDAAEETAAAGLLTRRVIRGSASGGSEDRSGGSEDRSGGSEDPPYKSDVHIAATRATALIPPGWVVVHTVTVRTADGGVVARMCTALHVSARACRTTRRADLRAAAERILRELREADVHPAIDTWLATVRATHEAAVNRQLARERSLRDRVTRTGALQPGLFDRRAVDAAEHREQESADLTAERTRQIAWLERSRPLIVTTDPVAVLFAWR